MKSSGKCEYLESDSLNLKSSKESTLSGWSSGEGVR